jgi:hypothetical protein
MRSPFKKHRCVTGSVGLEPFEDRCLLSGIQSLISQGPSGLLMAPAIVLHGPIGSVVPAGLPAGSQGAVSTLKGTVGLPAGSEVSVAPAGPLATTGSSSTSDGSIGAAVRVSPAGSAASLGISTTIHMDKSIAGGQALPDRIDTSVTGDLAPRGLGIGGQLVSGNLGLGGSLDLGFGSGGTLAVEAKLTSGLVDPSVLNLVAGVHVQSNGSTGLTIQLDGAVGDDASISAGGQAGSGSGVQVDINLCAGDSSANGDVTGNPNGASVYLSLSDTDHSGNSGGGPGGSATDGSDSGTSHGQTAGFRPGNPVDIVFDGGRNPGLYQQVQQGNAGRAEGNAPSFTNPANPFGDGRAPDNSFPLESEPAENFGGGSDLTELKPDTTLLESDLVALLLLQTNLLTGADLDNTADLTPGLGGPNTQAGAVGGVSEADQEPFTFAPESEARLADLLPADLTSLELDVQRFVEIIEQLAGGLSGLLGQMKLTTWLLVVAAAAVGTALLRRRICGSERMAIAGSVEGAWFPGSPGDWMFDE